MLMGRSHRLQPETEGHAPIFITVQKKFKRAKSSLYRANPEKKHLTLEKLIQNAVDAQFWGSIDINLMKERLNR